METDWDDDSFDSDGPWAGVVLEWPCKLCLLGTGMLPLHPADEERTEDGEEEEGAGIEEITFLFKKSIPFHIPSTFLFLPSVITTKCKHNQNKEGSPF